ncbi:hypothetical protein FEK50_05230 [Escherichia sp. E2586]|nr:hypothetical protein D9737_23495 [Escherichia sp. E10V4]TLI75929.1 hypothetical protein FEK50_05230 [Escherichia sp. E2586]
MWPESGILPDSGPLTSLLQTRGRQRYLIRPLTKIWLFLDYRYFFVKAHSLCCIDTPKVN